MKGIRIGQKVEFKAWADHEHHKDGPEIGEVGEVAGFEDSMIEVIYREGAPNQRTIHHYRAELKPIKELTDEPRRTSADPIPVG